MNDNELRYPEDETEFSDLMETIDAELIERGVPIPQRQLAAVGLLGKYTPNNSYRMPKDREPTPGTYIGDDLVLHTLRWSENRYGEALKQYWGPGSTVIRLKGDFWEIRYPLVTGDVAFIVTDEPDAPCSVSVKGSKDRLISYADFLQKYSGVRCLSVLDYMHDFPAQLVQSLDIFDKEWLLNVFRNHRYALEGLRHARDFQFVRSARNDLAAAVQHLVSVPVHTGLSKWSSLQATEKLLKSYIASHGGTVRHTHNLRLLAQTAYNLGLPEFKPHVIDAIICEAGVRYDESVVTKDDAYGALHGSIAVAGLIAIGLVNESRSSA